jgi:ribosomal protein L25 (general stress protein Ctc)
MKGLELPPQNFKLKPFDITFQISTIDEAKILLLTLENSSATFEIVIKDIRRKVIQQGHVL